MFTAQPDMDRLFQLPPTYTHVGGNDKCLPFREIIRRLEVSEICVASDVLSLQFYKFI